MGAGAQQGPEPKLTFKRRTRSLRRWLIALPIPPLIWLFQRVPFRIMRASLRILVGRTARSLQGKAALHHLQLAYGEAMDPPERRRIVKKLGQHLGDYIAENLCILRHGFQAFEGSIDDREARAIMQRANASCPEGILGITAHIGNWEMTALWSGRYWHDHMGGVIAKRIANAHLNRIVAGFRTRAGLHTIYMDAPPSAALKLLRRGSMIGMLPDQNLSKLSGTFIDFFGRPAYTTIGPARLALAARVPIFTCFCLRTESGFRIVMNEPIVPDLSRPRDEEIERLTRAWSAQVEATIREYPDQWAWFHNRWRTTPADLEARGRQRR